MSVFKILLHMLEDYEKVPGGGAGRGLGAWVKMGNIHIFVQGGTWFRMCKMGWSPVSTFLGVSWIKPSRGRPGRSGQKNAALSRRTSCVEPCVLTSSLSVCSLLAVQIFRSVRRSCEAVSTQLGPTHVCLRP